MSDTLKVAQDTLQAAQDTLQAVATRTRPFDYVRNIKLSMTETLGETIVGILYAVVILIVLLFAYKISKRVIILAMEEHERTDAQIRQVFDDVAVFVYAGWHSFCYCEPVGVSGGNGADGCFCGYGFGLVPSAASNGRGRVVDGDD